MKRTYRDRVGVEYDPLAAAGFSAPVQWYEKVDPRGPEYGTIHARRDGDGVRVEHSAGWSCHFLSVGDFERWADDNA